MSKPPHDTRRVFFARPSPAPDATLSHARSSLRAALRLAASHRRAADWLFTPSEAPFHPGLILPPELFSVALAVSISHEIPPHLPSASAPLAPPPILPFAAALSDAAAAAHVLLVPVARVDGITLGYSFGRPPRPPHPPLVRPVVPARAPLLRGLRGGPFPNFIGRFAFDDAVAELLVVTNELADNLLALLSVSPAADGGRVRRLLAVPKANYAFANLPDRVVFSMSNEETCVEPENTFQFDPPEHASPHKLPPALDDLLHPAFATAGGHPPADMLHPSEIPGATPPCLGMLDPAVDSGCAGAAPAHGLTRETPPFFSAASVDQDVSTCDLAQVLLPEGLFSPGTSPSEKSSGDIHHAAHAPADNLAPFSPTAAVVAASAGTCDRTQARQQEATFAPFVTPLAALQQLTMQGKSSGRTLSDTDPDEASTDGTITASSKLAPAYAACALDALQAGLSSTDSLFGAWMGAGVGGCAVSGSFAEMCMPETRSATAAFSGPCATPLSTLHDTHSERDAFDMTTLRESISVLERSLKGRYYGRKLRRDFLDPVSGSVVGAFRGELGAALRGPGAEMTRMLQQRARQSYYAAVLDVDPTTRAVGAGRARHDSREERERVRREKNRMSAARSNERKRVWLEGRKRELGWLKQREAALRDRLERVRGENRSLKEMLAAEVAS